MTQALYGDTILTSGIPIRSGYAAGMKIQLARGAAKGISTTDADKVR